ncbi:putative RNase H-like HicB family nuclease [Enterobacter sp. BIGb0383]|uniref:type II toxin-antitoxin system HicB family antitoxin n=1 Tax=unclassified Enterobacter TaxID=2608935 RepID=UPI000F497214|nr:MULTISPECIES: type II toxin-antitoxin system HicB family antitoxin [unclassified Enterobacter]ROP56286.1 putative RNase H-like HicB family nuclease [Enterobacter sp. BIGb0383]ROS06025.1 putative RNase H-like HicB family nuclease [Enterobacter sp. BIGb0359]
MKYPVYLHQAESGAYSGFVPDIEGCYFAGDTIDDAIADAHAAIDMYLEYQSEKGLDVPIAKTINDHKNDEDCRDGLWGFVDIDISRFEGKAIKLNITLPQNLLSKIDSYVMRNGEYSSRSGFLAELARRELLKHS